MERFSKRKNVFEINIERYDMLNRVLACKKLEKIFE